MDWEIKSITSTLAVASPDFELFPCATVKLAPTYAALALSLSTVTALHVRTLCTRTHELGSGDVKLGN